MVQVEVNSYKFLNYKFFIYFLRRFTLRKYPRVTPTTNTAVVIKKALRGLSEI